MVEPTEKQFFDFITARDGAALVGYSPDYVARLAREGKIISRRQGRQWLVDRDSLKLFTLAVEAEKRKRNIELKEQRRQEKILDSYLIVKTDDPRFNVATGRLHMLEAVVVMACAAFVFMLVQTASDARLTLKDVTEGMASAQADLQQALVFDSLPDWNMILWLFKHENVSSPETVTVESSVARSQPQAGNRRAETPAPVNFLFSDLTELDIADDRHGTITAVFRSGKQTEYALQEVVNGPPQ